MKKLITPLVALSSAIIFSACGSSSDGTINSETITKATTSEIVTDITTVTQTYTVNTTTTKAEETASATTPTTTTEIYEAEDEAENVVINSSKEYVEKIGEQFEITDITTMAAEMIGAEEGTSFKYNGNKFEIYRFNESAPQLEEAASGSMTYSIEGFGDLTSYASVNGMYLMLYNTPDDAIINAFK